MKAKVYRFNPATGEKTEQEFEIPDNLGEMSDDEFAEYFVREHCVDLYLEVDGDKARIVRIPTHPTKQ